MIGPTVSRTKGLWPRGVHCWGWGFKEFPTRHASAPSQPASPPNDIPVSTLRLGGVLVLWTEAHAQAHSGFLVVEPPALLMKSKYLRMIMSNQNSMNKILNVPNKRQCLHQQNHPPGTLVFVLDSSGTGKGRGVSSQMAVGPPGCCSRLTQR